MFDLGLEAERDYFSANVGAIVEESYKILKNDFTYRSFDSEIHKADLECSIELSVRLIENSVLYNPNILKVLYMFNSYLSMSERF